MKLKHYTWHRFVYAVLRSTAGLLVGLYMDYRCEKHKGPDTASLIISNHNSDLDAVLVGRGFSRHMYFLASEHTFRVGFASKLLKFVFDPIPFSKTISDVSAIKDMLRRLKAGASV